MSHTKPAIKHKKTVRTQDDMRENDSGRKGSKHKNKYKNSSHTDEMKEARAEREKRELTQGTMEITDRITYHPQQKHDPISQITSRRPPYQ